MSPTSPKRRSRDQGLLSTIPTGPTLIVSPRRMTFATQAAECRKPRSTSFSLDPTANGVRSLQQNTDPTSWRDARIQSHIDGIDLSQPVQIVELQPNQLVTQFPQPGAPLGDYFTPPEGINPNTIVINPAGRIPVQYAPDSPTSALRSISADTTNNLNLPKNVRGAGGGTQFLFPQKGNLTPTL